MQALRNSASWRISTSFPGGDLVDGQPPACRFLTPDYRFRMTPWFSSTGAPEPTPTEGCFAPFWCHAKILCRSITFSKPIDLKQLMYFWIGLDSRNINFNIRRKINVTILKYFMIYDPFRPNNLGPFDRKILCAAVLLSELKRSSPSHIALRERSISSLQAI